MKLLHYVLALLLPLTSLSSPTPGGGWDDRHCLSDADAALLVDVFVSLSVNFDPNYVTQFMTDDFTLQSDSIAAAHVDFSNVADAHFIDTRNWILDLPSGAITFPDKATLLAGAGALIASGPQPPIDVSVIIHSCTDIAYRSVTEEETPVAGIHMLRTRYEDGMWKAFVAYDEINTAADLYALGVTGCKLPPQTT